jgi:predicted HicB family RNase H-like nuclease
MDGPKRAAKGSIGSAILVRLPDDLRGRIEKAAAKAGLSIAEWIRQTAETALTKPRARRAKENRE